MTASMEAAGPEPALRREEAVPLHLSRLAPNLRCREARRDLDDAYEMHRTLMRAFPGSAEGGPGRVLWRTDLPRGDGRPVVLVQSEKPPAWTGLPEGWLASAAECKPWNPAFAAGYRLSFRLRANPSKRLSPQSKGPNGEPVEPRWAGKRVELRDEEEQLAWLARKATEAGFRVIWAVPVAENRDAASRAVGRKGGRGLSVSAVRFDGLLTVTDPTALAVAVRAGIGPAKAFGFGLLSLARPG
jgi:CRISPR system Cascade subunit CasE